MNINRKMIAFMCVIMIGSFLLGNIAVVAAPDVTGGLEDLWNAIWGIEEDVADLQIESQLELRIEELEVEVAELRGVLDLLDDPWIYGPAGPKGEEGPP